MKSKINRDNIKSTKENSVKDGNEGSITKIPGEKTGFQAVKLAGIGFLTALICVALLTGSSCIPRSAVKDNLKKSALYFQEQELFPMLKDGAFFTIQDNYADAILGSMIYYIDSTHPLTSSLQASYYQPKLSNINEAFVETVESETAPNINYYRYWHGSMVLVRPLLMITDMAGVRMILGVLTMIMALVAAALLWRKKERALAVIFLLGMCAMDVWMLCFCIEYVTTFLIMDGVLITLLLLYGKGRCSVTEYMPLFLTSGIVTAFMDFLTTETITFTVPVFLLLVLLYHDECLKTVKQGIAMLLKLGSLWLTGYAVMFALKWLSAALCFGTEAIKDSLSQAAIRIAGQVNLGNSSLSPTASTPQRLFGAIWHNLGCLIHVTDELNSAQILLIVFIGIVLIFSLVYLFHTTHIPTTLYLPLGLLAMLPYGRYLVLSNHAYLHYFFTYRAQLVTVMLILLLLWENALPGLWSLMNRKRKS